MKPDCATCEKVVNAGRLDAPPAAKRYCFDCPGSYVATRFRTLRGGDARLISLRSCRRVVEDG